VEEHVPASLTDTLPNPDWLSLARYVMSRALIHGKRRFEEVAEVVVTVAEPGQRPAMSETSWPLMISTGCAMPCSHNGNK
jgi:hypothetical protein